MANYDRPGKKPNYEGDQKKNTTQHEAIRRDKVREPKTKMVAKLGTDPASSWPPGTIWLKTLDVPEA